MALIRDAIRIDNWARAQHRDHTGDVRPEWCPLCHSPEPEPPSPAAPVARPRYRLTPEGVVPCPTPRSIETCLPHSLPSSTVTTARTATANPPTTTRRSVARAKRTGCSDAFGAPSVSRRKTRGAGAYAGLLDRLEAIGATFCPDCYAYLWPEHTHLTRGPIVPLGTVTLAEPCVVDGIDGQSELVTIQEREAA